MYINTCMDHDLFLLCVIRQKILPHPHTPSAPSSKTLRAESYPGCKVTTPKAWTALKLLGWKASVTYCELFTNSLRLHPTQKGYAKKLPCCGKDTCCLPLQPSFHGILRTHRIRLHS